MHARFLYAQRHQVGRGNGPHVPGQEALDRLCAGKVCYRAELKNDFAA